MAFFPAWLARAKFPIIALGLLGSFLLWSAPREKDQMGLASWYGAESGRETASGETFDPGQLTAAHRKLPFNSLVRVTNLRNGRSVEVRINDRGPYAQKRILDLSTAAADRLEMKKSGVVPVKIQVLRLGDGRAAP